MYLGINVGKSCNMKCKYCCEFPKTEEPISYEQIEAFLYAVFSDYNPLNLKLSDNINFGFIGGEPLLYMDKIEFATNLFFYITDKCDFVDNDKCQLCIATNGTLLDTQPVKEYIKKYGDYITLSVSLDGIKEANDINRIYLNGEGTFDKILYNYNHVSKVKHKYLGAVLSYNNVKYAFESIKFFMENDFDVEINSVRDRDASIIERKTYIEQLDKCIDWYAHKSDKWVLEHRVKFARRQFCPQFMLDSHFSKACVEHQINNVVVPEGKFYTNYRCNNNAPKFVINGDDIDFLNSEIIRNLEDCDDLKFNKTSPCYRCVLGGGFTDCNGKYMDSCNFKIFFYLLQVFFSTYWLIIKQRYGGLKEHKIDLVVPKKEALRVISEQQYDYIVSLIKETKGDITPLDSMFYSEEQAEALSNMCKD